MLCLCVLNDCICWHIIQQVNIRWKTQVLRLTKIVSNQPCMSAQNDHQIIRRSKCDVPYVQSQMSLIKFVLALQWTDWSGFDTTITITRKGPVSLVKILDRITLDPFVNENMKRWCHFRIRHEELCKRKERSLVLSHFNTAFFRNY